MTRALSCRAAVLLVVFCVGCPSPDTGSVPIEEVPDRLGPVYCRTLGGCLGIEDFFAADQEQCEAYITPLLRNSVVAEWQYGIDRGTLVYDGEQVQACLDAFESLGCAVYNSGVPVACRLAAQGQVPPGGACELDVECESPARCEFDLMCPGVCVALLPAGAACESGSECENSLDCFNNQCAARGEAGADCGGSVAPYCATGLFCRGEDFTTSTPGTCVANDSRQTAGEGEMCQRYGGEPVCELGLFCVLVTAPDQYQCQAAVASGGTCRFGQNQCPSGEYCAGASSTGTNGVCTALPTLSQPCPDMQCAAGTRCIGGTCLTPGENGASCVEDNDCYSFNCTAGVCAIRICEN